MRARGSSATFLCTFAVSTLLLSACAKETHLSDTAPGFGDPLLVTSKISVDTCRYSDAVSPSGCRVERADIGSWVVMPRGTYAQVMAEKKAAEDAVSRAEAAVIQAAKDNRIIKILAMKCRENNACYAAAEPHVIEALKQ